MKPIKYHAAIFVGIIVGGCTHTIEPTDLSSVRIGANQESVKRVLGEPIDTLQLGTLKLAKFNYDKGGSGSFFKKSEGGGSSGIPDPRGIFFLPILLPIAGAYQHQEIKKEQRGILTVIYNKKNVVVWHGDDFSEQLGEFSSILEAYGESRKGNAKAILLLAEFGRDEKQNWRWHCDLANQGNVRAQELIAAYFRNTSPPNFEYAYIWSSLSTLNDNLGGESTNLSPYYRDIVAEKLTSEQRERADQIVDKFKPHGRCDPDQMGQMKWAK